MGQKCNPIGNRLGIIRGWESNWFGGKDYAKNVVEDEKIRNYLKVRIPKAGISRIVIERNMKRITVTIHTSRPGIIIGKSGSEVESVRKELNKLTQQDVQINIHEIRKPELDAAIVGETIAKQLEGRINHRKAIKNAIDGTMRGEAVQGIKIRVSGRLAGSDMARREEYKKGRVPLHTLRADIDYALIEAQTVYGKIGIKVWICKGEVFGKRDLSLNVGSPVKEGDRRGGGDNRGDNRGGRDGNRGGRGGGRNNNNNNDRKRGRNQGRR